jgi:hypothetical protein
LASHTPRGQARQIATIATVFKADWTMPNRLPKFSMVLSPVCSFYTSGNFEMLNAKKRSLCGKRCVAYCLRVHGTIIAENVFIEN